MLPLQWPLTICNNSNWKITLLRNILIESLAKHIRSVRLVITLLQIYCQRRGCDKNLAAYVLDHPVCCISDAVWNTTHDCCSGKLRLLSELYMMEIADHLPYCSDFAPLHFVSVIASEVQHSIACISFKTCSQAQPSITSKIHFSPDLSSKVSK